MSSTSAGQRTPTTNVGLLPSTTPAPSCSVLAITPTFPAVERNSTTTSSLRLQRNFVNVYYTGGGGSTASCLPESYYSCVVHQSNPIFSSAAACPPGYEPMCTFVAVGAAVTAAPTVSLWTVLGAGDAAIGCCPR